MATVLTVTAIVMVMGPANIITARILVRIKSNGDRSDDQGSNRLGRDGEKVRHRERFRLHDLGTQRGAGHHQRPLRPESAHRGIEALGTPWRPRCVYQSRGVPDLERLLRLRNPSWGQARAPAPAVRRDDLCA